MAAAVQDVNNFIERQRSKLNKPTGRQAANRPRPVPAQARPALQTLRTTTNPLEDRLDIRVARILEEPTPRVRSQQSYFPPSTRASLPSRSYREPPQPAPPSFSEQQLRRRASVDNAVDNSMTFFDKFGTYDEKRVRLKDELKRDYNEYLHTTQGGSTKQSTGQKNVVSRHNTRRIPVSLEPSVVAPWERINDQTARNARSMNDVSSTTTRTKTTTEYGFDHSGPSQVRSQDEQYVRDREEYILELHAQIRELEERKRQLELRGSQFSSSATSSQARSHYTEDLQALNALLMQRIDQRNALDLELTRILHRPAVTTSPTHVEPINIPNLSMPLEQVYESSTQRSVQQTTQRSVLSHRNEHKSEPASGNGGLQIGQETDKELEQEKKKRYKQELDSQVRESQMRKAQAKQEKDEQERKLESDTHRYDYFGRSGGGAPMRDKDGNVIANLGDLRNPQQAQPSARSPIPLALPPQQQPSTDRVHSSIAGASAITNAPFYNGEPAQNPATSARPETPNHARGAVVNGIFGAVKTEEQLRREEKYKQDLRNQIDEKQQRAAEEAARRRTEEERELAKQLEWQQLMERQKADEASRRHDIDTQEQYDQQRLHDELERQRQHDEMNARQRSRTPIPVDYSADRSRQRSPYRSASPPIPTKRNKIKSDKSTQSRTGYHSFDEEDEDDDEPEPPRPQPRPPARSVSQLSNAIDESAAYVFDGKGANPQRQATARKKSAAPRRAIPIPARKRPTKTYRPPPPVRTGSMISLRSDGSDSEVLNRLEHLKRQLKDKEDRLSDHASRSLQSPIIRPPPPPPLSQSPQIQRKVIPRPYVQQKVILPPSTRRQTIPSPVFDHKPMPLPYIEHRVAPQSHTEHKSKVWVRPLSKTSSISRQHSDLQLEYIPRTRRYTPNTRERILRVIQADDDDDVSGFRPNYFRDDSILMRAGAEHILPSKRVDLVDGIFVTNLDDSVRLKGYSNEPPGFYDRDYPNSMANLELGRIVEQNEHRLKKLRDLEADSTSHLDSNEVLERFQQKQRLQKRGSQTTLQDDTWLR